VPNSPIRTGRSDPSSDRAADLAPGAASAGRIGPAESSSEVGALRIATLHLDHVTGPWMVEFSRRHPPLRVDILNRIDIDTEFGVSDIWISGEPPGAWARDIAAHSDVRKVDALAEVGGGSIYRVTDRNPPVVHLYRRLGLPIQYPVEIRGGSVRWEVVARSPEFDRVIEYAREIDPEVRVVNLRRRSLRSHLPQLTEAQQELLSRAMAEGYFSVPRDITLTELARRLDRSKSSVSEAIALIEKKLLESAFPYTRYTT